MTSPLDTLTDREAAALRALHARWVAARAAKDYTAADVLRAELTRHGAYGADYSRWLPVFESSEARANRLAARERGAA